MALNEDATVLAVPMYEAQKRVLPGLAEAKTLPKLLQRRDWGRNGYGTCHLLYFI
jgi:hypothetical protein